MANVLLLTRGTGGDVTPIAKIGNGLKARGHEVTLITSYSYEKHARQAGLRFAGLDSPEETERFLQETDRLASPIEFARYFRQRLIPKIPQECAIIQQQYRPGDTILVCFDVMNATGQLSAEKLNIPFVLFYSAPKNVELRFGRFAATQTSIGRSETIGAEMRAVLDLPPEWSGGPVCRMGHWPAWFAPLGPDVPFEVTPIGFIFDRSTDPPPAEVQAFLEAGPPPILITHGTSRPKDPAFFHMSAAACQRLGERGMLVASDATLLPDPLPAGVAWFPYVPYGSLMPHLRAIVHHGGLGTVGAAMLAGLPQLIMPAGYDRRDNAINVQRLGIGDFVRPAQWQAETITAVLALLIDSPAVRARCQEVAGWMRAMDPVATACDLIEEVLAGKRGVQRAATEPTEPDTEAVILENTFDVELRRRLSDLSPEKRALLAARLKKQIRHDH